MHVGTRRGSDTYKGLSTDSVLTRPSFPQAGGCLFEGWRLGVAASSLRFSTADPGMLFSPCDRKNETGMWREHSEEGRKNQIKGHRRSETWAKCFQEKLPWSKSHTLDLVTG